MLDCSVVVIRLAARPAKEVNATTFRNVIRCCSMAEAVSAITVVWPMGIDRSVLLRFPECFLSRCISRIDGL